MKTLLILNDPPYGTERSTLDELTDWSIWADKVITF